MVSQLFDDKKFKVGFKLPKDLFSIQITQPRYMAEYAIGHVAFNTVLK